MTPRSIRRAIERKAAKLARKAERAAANNTAAEAPVAEATDQTAKPPIILTDAFDFTDEEDDNLAMHATPAEKAFAAGASIDQNENDMAAADEPAPKPISAAKLAANQQNAKHSTGPRSSIGRARVALNAIKTGLTAQTIVLTAEQAPFYQAHLDRRFAHYAPVTDDEQILVQTIVENEWRIAQIAPLEAAIYAIGLRQFSDEFTDELNPATREALILGRTLTHYRRDLSNLSLQERRIRNHIEKDVAKLTTLQQRRLERRKNQIAHCLRLHEEHGDIFQASECGFDFSNSELQTFLQQTATQFRLTQRRPDFDRFLITLRRRQKGAKGA